MPLKTFIITVGFCIAIAQPAYAYLDPGSGSMILQLLLGGVAGAAVVIKLYWRRFLSLLGAGKDKKTESEPDGSGQ
jgi:hypothetical protein